MCCRGNGVSQAPSPRCLGNYDKQYSHSLQNGPPCTESCFVILYLGTLPALCAFSIYGSWDSLPVRHTAGGVQGLPHSRIKAYWAFPPLGKFFSLSPNPKWACFALKGCKTCVYANSHLNLKQNLKGSNFIILWENGRSERLSNSCKVKQTVNNRGRIQFWCFLKSMLHTAH